MPALEANGTRMHYVVDDYTPPWEDSETLYIQHGAGRTVNFWTPWVPHFAGKYRVVRRDLRGHGDSEIPAEGHPYSLDELVADTIGFLNELGLERVHYIGESTGGIVGLAAAARHPDRFASLTVTGAPPIIAASQVRALAGDAENPHAALERGGTEAWIRDYLIPANIISGGNSQAHHDWVVSEYSRTPTQVLQGYTGNINSVDLIPELPAITAPTLVLAPTRSPMTPLEDQLAIWQAIPDARLAVIDGPGHEIYVDCAEDCINAVSRFLAKVAA